MNNWFDIPCEDACVNGLPSWSQRIISDNEDCCTDQEKSQICTIWLAPDDQTPIAAWDEASILAWSANVDNTDTTGTKIKTLTVEGEIGKPTPNEQPLPKGKTRIEDYTYNPVFTRRCITPEINDWLREVQKGNASGRMWYQTLGGFFYGGLNGIELDKLFASPTNAGGVSDVRIWEIEPQYTICVDPPRIASPFA